MIMTMARKQLVDVEMTRYYHCISRCVCRAFLCGEGLEHRKDWIENRLRELAAIFSLDVCGFAVMDNHCRAGRGELAGDLRGHRLEPGRGEEVLGAGEVGAYVGQVAC